ncbi:MAG TPA: hypothetical protein VLH56_19605 [Dissulfurispiraceae bacterium]|nr:hypothetical protein [Dissulfurispiraceae bacterium]
MKDQFVYDYVNDPDYAQICAGMADELELTGLSGEEELSGVLKNIVNRIRTRVRERIAARQASGVPYGRIPGIDTPAQVPQVQSASIVPQSVMDTLKNPAVIAGAGILAVLLLTRKR